MERREFLKNTAAACLFASLPPLNGCVNYKTVIANEETGKLKIKKSDFGDSTFVVVNTRNANAPIYVVKQDDEKYVALLMLCTHKSCELKPLGNILICPCHGSEFSSTGQVLKEPANHNLKQFETFSDKNYIYISLK
jgi:cytochrome b6-f complex iron-sulfur subunit